MNATQEREINETVRGFVLSAVNIPALRNDEDLFQAGIVNSLFAIQLMTFIERTFSIEVGTDDLDIENFKSIDATTAFIVRKNGQRRE
jgi:acyl carrier protein